MLRSTVPTCCRHATSALAIALAAMIAGSGCGSRSSNLDPPRRPNKLESMKSRQGTGDPRSAPPRTKPGIHGRP